MLSKAYLLQFLFLAFTINAMSETFPHDTTDLPDDQKELKEVESSRGDARGFSSHPPYENAIFGFHKASEDFPDLPYHLDLLEKTENSWDLDSDRSISSDGSNGDVFSDIADLSKRGNRMFKQNAQKFKFDPALNYLGLGKRGKSDRPKYDPALGFLGLGKRSKSDRSRPKYDPALGFLGLGKRDNSDRPKYNPGWKFIGLGKRIMPLFHSLDSATSNANRMSSKDLKASKSEETLLPHMRILSMTPDVSMFSENLRGSFQGNPLQSDQRQSSISDQFPFGLFNPTENGETLPKAKHSVSGFLAVVPQDGNSERSRKPQHFFTRSRKPTRLWRNNSKPIYDPGWLMTGLGK